MSRDKNNANGQLALASPTNNVWWNVYSTGHGHSSCWPFDYIQACLRIGTKLIRQLALVSFRRAHLRGLGRDKKPSNVIAYITRVEVINTKRCHADELIMTVFSIAISPPPVAFETYCSKTFERNSVNNKGINHSIVTFDCFAFW